MTRAEIKAAAREQLGNNIFCNKWIYAVIAGVVVAVVSGLLNIIPGIGSVAALVVSGPVAFAVAYLFLKQARDGELMNLSDLTIGFKTDFAGTFLIFLMTTIFTFLWSLLLIVPGIVKAYAYSMAYYIKADHPDYDWRKCLDESQRVMNGHKMELFVQDLSFIGWIIVGSLCLGIGTLWVSAYMNAARAQFYDKVICGSAASV